MAVTRKGFAKVVKIAKPIIEEIKKVQGKGVLQDIRIAEEKAELILDNARAKKQKMIADAKTAALKENSFKKEMLKEQRKKRMEKAKREIATEKEKILFDNQKQLKKLEENAKKNLNKAIDFVLKRVEQEIIR